MDIQTNHTVRLLNAKCEYVLAVDNLVKKLDYGDDIECCLNKLFLASKLINRLECYCFEDKTLADTEVLSTFTIDIFNDLSDAETYSLAVNGSYLADYLSDGAIDLSTVFENLLVIANLDYTASDEDGFTRFNVAANCDTTDIFFKKTSTAGAEYESFVPTVFGVCSTSCCHNCIKDSDLREMYAVLEQLLS
jgi:hypothetical protein